ncbi:hypothetical protein [Deinococcus hopiensis]|uniref:Uncharacterized protein n=1 Tax=Deinococcus hopiensis KR-140 TaxID=695939 RepID=A0A1W1V5Y2_9DEIO|nr:hypothetical protein [Deinococcus hopiensis]SMB88819.1 hypothetical protein SAMN00790413_00188 [Deinococcus hopiensis KR-140]
MPDLTDELRSLFALSWGCEDDEALPMWSDTEAVGGINPPLQQKLIRLLADRAQDLLPLLREDQEHLWTFTQARLLVRVLAHLEEGTRALQRLAAGEGGPYTVSMEEDAAQILAARKDAGLIPFFRQLVLSSKVRSQVWTIALHVLVDAKDGASVKALQAVYGGPNSRAVANARVRLGDITALRPLLQTSARFYVEEASQAISLLEQRLKGLAPLLEELVSANPELLLEPSCDPLEQLEHLALHDPMLAVQEWATRQLVSLARERFASLVPKLLGQPDWMVVKSTSDALARIQPPLADELNALVSESGCPHSIRLWAIRTLLLAGIQPELSGLPEVRVTLPPAVPEEARDTVVRYWVRTLDQAEAGTDVRWLIEGLTREWGQPDVTDEHEAVVAALRSDGLTTAEPVDVGTWNEQGWGTYVVLKTEGGQLWLSELARFAWPADPQDEAMQALRPRLERALSSVGWRMLPEEAAPVVFPDLNIYYFAHRKSLPLQKLLFYYQD